MSIRYASAVTHVRVVFIHRTELGKWDAPVSTAVYKIADWPKVQALFTDGHYSRIACFTYLRAGERSS